LEDQNVVVEKLILDIIDSDSSYQHQNINLIRRATEYRPITEKNNLEMISQIEDERIRRELQNYFVFSGEISEVQREYEAIVIDMLRAYLMEHGMQKLGTSFPKLNENKIDIIDIDKLLKELKNEKFQQILQERKLKSEEFMYYVNLVMEHNRKVTGVLLKEIPQ
jgi:hypothetical protein